MTVYLEWEKTLEFNIDDLHNSFRTGPIIRGLSLGDNGDYICEVYFFKDELGENFDVRYRKTIVSLKETDGYWTVTEIAEIEDVIAGDDTMYLKDNHSSVVWSAEFDGYKLNMSSVATNSVNAPFKNGYNLNYQYGLCLDPNSRAELNLNSNFWDYYDGYFVSLTDKNGKEFSDTEIKLNLEYGYKKDDITVRSGSGMFISNGSFSYVNGIELEQMPIVTSATATVEIDGVIHEVELTREVILP